MNKLLKYEFRNSAKNVKYIFIISAVASLFINFYIHYYIFNTFGNESLFYSGGNYVVQTIFSLIFAVFIFVILGSIIALFVSLGEILNKDLNTSRAYLTLSFPVSSFKLIAAKFIVAFVWILGVYGFLILLNGGVNALIIMISKNDPLALARLFEVIRENFSSVLNTGVNYIVSSLKIIGLIFLSVVLDKLVRKNRAGGKLWILYFIGLSILMGIIETLIIPASLSSNSSIIGFVVGIRAYNFNSTVELKNYYDYTILIGSIINLVEVVIFYFVTSFLCKKVEI